MTTVAGSISDSRRPRGRVRERISQFFGRSISAGGVVTPATTVAPAVPQQSTDQIQDAVVPFTDGTTHDSATLTVAAVPVAAATPASGTAVVDASILGNQVTATAIPSILITGAPSTGNPLLSNTGNPAISHVSAATNSVPGHLAGVTTGTSR